MKEKHGKVFTIILCMIMVFALASCKGKTDGDYGGDTLGGENKKAVSLIDEAWAYEGTEGDEADSEVVLEKLDYVSDKVMDISMEIFRESVDKDKNSMISPISILMALTMVEMGAENDSLKQMEETFGCSSEDLSCWLKAWRSSLKTGEKTKMNIANSFWFRDMAGLNVNEEYLKKIAFYLDADAYKTVFDSETVKEVNQWCNENTYGMIEKIIEQFREDDLALIMNATAFEGVWEKEYEDYQIHEAEDFYCEDGTKQKADMLYSTENKYIEDEKATGFIKPYMDGYSFVAILPKEGVSISEYVEGLSKDAFKELMLSSRKEEVHAVIPEFKSEYQIDNLIQILQKMGIKNIFSPNQAELFGMFDNKDDDGNVETSENFYIGYIKHKTFIEVNRKGTKAAAVTAIGISATSAMIDKKIYEVRLDRPFVYAIIDDATETPIFIGTTMTAEAV